MNNTPEMIAAPVQEQQSGSIDFKAVDAIRNHMLLTVESMRSLIGCTRVTYYNWLNGAEPRDLNARRVRALMRKLVYLVSNNQWPTPEVYVAKQKERLEMLKTLLADLDKTEAVEYPKLLH